MPKRDREGPFLRRARAHVVFAFVACNATLGVAALSSACGGEDQDPARSHSDGMTAVGPDGAPLPTGTTTSPTSTGTYDPGAPPELPDGAPLPPGIDAGKAFDYAPPYVANLGPSSRSDAGHNFAANTPRSNPRGTICLDCHKVGGAAAGRPFFAGGTVKQTSGAPAPSVEVRLKAYISPNAVTAYTDDDGNWFITPGAAADAGVGFSVRPGVRNATALRMMGPSAAFGRCNQCHIASL